jgi:hypothetical protein
MCEIGENLTTVRILSDALRIPLAQACQLANALLKHAE